MTPFYADDWVTIYHGDAREMLPEADVLVTDPPYGVEFAGKETRNTRKKGGGYAGGVDNPDVGPNVVRTALGQVARGAVFPGNRRFYAYPEPRDIGCVYCPSGAGIGPWGFTCFHLVLFYGSRRVSTVLRPTSIQSFATAGESDHPCPKPLPWLRWLIGLVSNPGEVILDPFAGTGTTLRAAKDLGRKAIGVEIEERYCELAARQCAQEVLDFGAVA